MRISLNVDEDLLVKIDAYAKRLGVSRSALMGMSTAQYIFTLEKAETILDKMTPKQMEMLDSMRK